MMSKVIYKVTHRESGRVYIGTTQDSLDKRRKDHLQKAKTGSGHKFQEAIATYGPQAFEWEQIDTGVSPEEAAEKERNYIVKYQSNEKGYNSDRGGGIKKSIYQYDVQNGNLLNVFNDLEAASKAVGVDRKSISKACLGEVKICSGYSWSYKRYEIYPYMEDGRKKRVHQIGPHGEIVKSYDSVIEASEMTGVNRSSIAKCCRGEYSLAGSYHWKYQD